MHKRNCISFLYIWVFCVVFQIVFLLWWDAVPLGYSVYRISSLSWILIPIHCYTKLCTWSRRSILFTTSSFYGITYIVKSRFSGCSLLLFCRPHIFEKMFLDARQSCFQIIGISCGLFSFSSCSEWGLFMCKTNMI